MLRLFRSNQQCTHNHYLNMFGLYKAACLLFSFVFFLFPIGKLRNISGASLGFQSKNKILSYIQCIQQFNLPSKVELILTQFGLTDFCSLNENAIIFSANA